MDNKTKSAHLNFGHMAVILTACAILVFITLFKSNFKFSLNQSTSAHTTYTYAQAQADARNEVENNSSSDYSDEQKISDQLSVLDPSTNAGQVLGASTESNGGDQVFPDAEEILTPEVLDAIKLKLSDAAGEDAVRQYKRDLEGVESADGVDVIMADLTSTDPNTLLEGSKKVEPLVKDMLQVMVPKELAEYHKIKMIYYMELSELADGYAGVQGVADPKDTGINIFSLSAKLQSIQSDIQNKYGVQL